jgi:hypothetical protein
MSEKVDPRRSNAEVAGGSTRFFAAALSDAGLSLVSGDDDMDVEASGRQLRACPPCTDLDIVGMSAEKYNHRHAPPRSRWTRYR